MSIYYLKTNADILYTLDATTEINLALNSRITSHPVEDGKSLTDNISHENNTVSFVGYISDSKSLSGRTNLSTEDYINGLFKIRAKKETFTVYFSTKLAPWSDCVFKSLSISQDKSNGSVAKGSSSIDSYKIVLSIEQIRVKKTISNIVVSSDEIKDLTQKKTESSGMKTQADKVFEARNRQAAGKAFSEEGQSLIGSVFTGN